MKKIWMPVLIIGLSMSLVACSDVSTSDSSSQDQSEQVEVDQELATKIREIVTETLDKQVDYMETNDSYFPDEYHYSKGFEFNRVASYVGNDLRITNPDVENIQMKIDSVRMSLEDISDEELLSNYDKFNDDIGVYKAFAMEDLHIGKEWLDMEYYSNPIKVFVNKITNGEASDSLEVLEFYGDAAEPLANHIKHFESIKERVNSEAIEDALSEEKKEEINELIDLFIEVAKDQVNVMGILLNADTSDEIAEAITSNTEKYESALQALWDAEESMDIDDDKRKRYGVPEFLKTF